MSDTIYDKIEAVEQSIREIRATISLPHQQEEKMAKIEEALIYATGYTIADIKLKLRSSNMVAARYIFIYHLRKKLQYTYQHIGKILKRDHSTIVHAVQEFENKLEIGDELITTTYTKFFSHLNNNK